MTTIATKTVAGLMGPDQVARLDALTPVRTPTIQAPTNGTTGVSRTPTISTLAFASLYGLTHAATRIQIASDEWFASVVQDVTLGAVTSWTAAQLAELATFHARTAHQASDGQWSAWSPTARFTTIETIIATPTITSPAGGATGIGETPLVTTSAYAITGGSETHLNTDWQIATDAAFNTIVAQSLADTSNKTSWTVPAAKLLVNTTYYARSRHRGSGVEVSAWSPTVSFTTSSSFVPISPLTLRTWRLAAANVSVWGVAVTTASIVVGLCAADTGYCYLAFVDPVSHAVTATRQITPATGGSMSGIAFDPVSNRLMVTAVDAAGAWFAYVVLDATAGTIVSQKHLSARSGWKISTGHPHARPGGGWLLAGQHTLADGTKYRIFLAIVGSDGTLSTLREMIDTLSGDVLSVPRESAKVPVTFDSSNAVILAGGISTHNTDPPTHAFMRVSADLASGVTGCRMTGQASGGTRFFPQAMGAGSAAAYALGFDRVSTSTTMIVSFSTDLTQVQALHYAGSSQFNNVIVASDGALLATGRIALSGFGFMFGRIDMGALSFRRSEITTTHSWWEHSAARLRAISDGKYASAYDFTPSGDYRWGAVAICSTLAFPTTTLPNHTALAAKDWGSTALSASALPATSALGVVSGAVSDMAVNQAASGWAVALVTSPFTTAISEA